MTEVRCPNCGTRFDRASAQFCPGADCGFPVDFMDVPEEDETAEEAILRRPDEPAEPPPEPEDETAEPPEPVPSAPAASPESTAPIEAPTEPQEPTPEPAEGEAGPGVPRWAVVAGVAVVAVVAIGLLVATFVGNGEDVVVNGQGDPVEPDPPPEEPDPPPEEPDPPPEEPDPGNGDPGNGDPPPPPDDAVFDVAVFFVDVAALQQGQEPFVREVVREIPHPDVDSAVATNVLDEFFAGPTAAEQQEGLELVRSGATGVADLSVSDGVLRLRLTGGCDRGDLPVTIADQLIPTLRQFVTVDFVKIFDPDGQTLEPDGRSDSIPACLAE